MLSLESEPFDLAVIDVDNPIIDGARLIALICATSPLGELAIMMITSMQEARATQECLQTGADNFMTKPVKWSQLAERLERVMALKSDREAVVQPAQARESALPVSSAT
jgi:DNA-binding response OmpR family regulator